MPSPINVTIEFPLAEIDDKLFSYYSYVIKYRKSVECPVMAIETEPIPHVENQTSQQITLTDLDYNTEYVLNVVPRRQITVLTYNNPGIEEGIESSDLIFKSGSTSIDQ